MNNTKQKIHKENERKSIKIITSFQVEGLITFIYAYSKTSVEKNKYSMTIFSISFLLQVFLKTKKKNIYKNEEKKTF